MRGCQSANMLPSDLLTDVQVCRLGRLAFHPFGRHLATASFDQTWRLWDVQTGQCLQEQVHGRFPPDVI